MFTEFWGRECKLVIRIQPLLPHSEIAVNRHVAKLRFPAFLAVMSGHVPLQHLWQGGGGRGGGGSDEAGLGSDTCSFQAEL